MLYKRGKVWYTRFTANGVRVKRLNNLANNMAEQAPGLGYQNVLEVINRIVRDAKTGEGK